MTAAAQAICVGLVVAAFIVICWRVSGVVHVNRISYPRAYWFGITSFAIFVILLIMAAIWTAVARP